MEKAHLDLLNFKVKSIETYLAVPFQGETIADKQEFVSKHWEERDKVVNSILSGANAEYDSGK